MNEIRHVLIVTGCDGATKRYRCLHKQEQLQLYGVRSLVVHYTDRSVLNHVDSFDMVILHRVPKDDFVDELIYQAHLRDRRVVFDTDDLEFDLEALPWIKALEQKSKVGAWFYADAIRRQRAVLDACDAVLVSTEYLAGRVQQIGKPAMVVRNALSRELIALSDMAVQRQRTASDRVVLGYFSGSKTHDYDFQEASDALLSILKNLPFVQLMVVGPLDVDSRFDAVREQIRRLDFVPWQKLPDLLAQVDINLAPLEQDNPFCQSKSELKYMEAAAVGVPTIASATDAFCYAIKHGTNGFLAGDLGEWEACLRSLIENPVLRDKIGRDAREHVMAHYSPKIRGRELLDSLETAREWRPPANLDFVEPSPSRETGIKLSPRHRFVDLVQPAGTDIVAEIRGERSVGQSLICRQNGFYRVDVKTTVFGGRTRGRIVFRLEERPDSPESIVTLEASPECVSDDGWLSFRFPAILGSRLKAYYFSLEMPDAWPLEGIGLFYCPDPFLYGTRYENGLPVGGSLVLRTFVMTEELPDSTETKSAYDDENDLTALRLSHSRMERDLLTRGRAIAGKAPPLYHFRSNEESSGAKSMDVLLQDGPISFLKLGYTFARWCLVGNRSRRRPHFRRYLRGTGGSLLKKAWLVWRYQGLIGLREEIRCYSRWRLSLSKTPDGVSPVEMDTSPIGEARRTGIFGFFGDVRDYFFLRLSR